MKQKKLYCIELDSNSNKFYFMSELENGNFWQSGEE